MKVRTFECMQVLKAQPYIFMPGSNHSWHAELNRLVAVGYVVMVKKTTTDNVEYEIPQLTADGLAALGN